ncbi:radical SAM protein [candidate division KSB1 bacterium]|nr:radical SAM protein [candidate division KSB1 bacterium]
MKNLKLLPFTSGGLILSYQCSNFCRHCVYASSPKWQKWMTADDVRVYLKNISECASSQRGLHIGGGEPFLNFELLLKTIELCVEFGVPLQYVETNAGWCDTDEKTARLLYELRTSGLPALLISASPFHNEFVPFDCTERAIRIATDIFGAYNVLIYTDYYYKQLSQYDHSKKLPFNRYVNTTGREQAAQDFIREYNLIPCGRAVTRLGYLYEKKPAATFFNNTCQPEFRNPNHIHIDPDGNYIPSFCAGISLGNARNLGELYQGIELENFPLLELLASKGVEGLLLFAKERFNYAELADGYIAKCDLCQDIRKHIVAFTDQFKELTPVEFYQNL